MDNFSDIKKIEKFDSVAKKNMQNDLLSNLIKYAHDHIPYYRKIINQSKIIKNGKVRLDLFHKLPILTKDILRNEHLSSDEHKKRKSYINHSGGSSGEPVSFIQDKYYNEWNIANKIYYSFTFGKNIGEKEIKIWGSERDVFEGTIGIKAKLHNFLFNRYFINSFQITDELTDNIIHTINIKKPKIIWGYVDSVYEIAQRIIKKNYTIEPPNAVVCSAGTLYSEMQETIEKAFHSKAINQYGSREVGEIACACGKSKNLHVFQHSNYVEVVDKNGHHTDGPGRILITTLRNYSMPLIRYEIGDIGEFAKTQTCSCGRNGQQLSMVWGRQMQVFYNVKGDAIPPEYFIHLVGVVFNTGEMKKFQIIQETLDKITIKFVADDNSSDAELIKMKHNIVEKTKLVMGNKCSVIFDSVDEIPKSKSGKYLYTINKLSK